MFLQYIKQKVLQPLLCSIVMQFIYRKRRKSYLKENTCRNMLWKKNNDRIVAKLSIDNICELCEIFGLGPILLCQIMMKLD